MKLVSVNEFGKVPSLLNWNNNSVYKKMEFERWGTVGILVCAKAYSKIGAVESKKKHD